MDHRDDELQREIRAHLELEAEERVADGLSESEARQAALRAFGNVTRTQEDTRAVWAHLWLEDAGRDVRYACRALWRNPGFTAVTVLTLALGIGATTAIFSVVNAALLRPLPFRDSDRLVRIVENIPASESFTGAAARMAAMYQGEFTWWRERTRTLQQLAVELPQARTLTMRDRNIRLAGARVSPALFAMRGVPPMMGRGLVPDDERADARVVAISARTWQRHFGGDRGTINSAIVLDGEPYTVVGVMPPDFGEEDFWTPYVATLQPPGSVSVVPVTARLRDGVSIEAAAGEIDSLGRELRRISPEAGGQGRFEVVRVQDEMVARIRPALRVLVVAVGVVLLIVCANVANLLLTRGARRQQEIALRRALGAARGRIIRQVLAESVVLAGGGGIAGVLLAYAGVELLKGLAVVDLPAGFGQAQGATLLPRINAIAIDLPVLAFALVTALVTGMLFGIAPALRLSRTNQAEVARNTTTNVSGRTRTGQLLAAIQLGLATTLLVGAGLLMHSFVKLAAVDLGFDPEHVLSFDLVLPEHYSAEQKLTITERLVAKLQAVPGVVAAGFTDIPPLSRRINPIGGYTLPPKDRTDSNQQDRRAGRLVSSGYLRAIGARLVEGRWPEDRDLTGATIAVVVTRGYARDYFGRTSSIDSVLPGEFRNGAVGPTGKIIGVVDDIRLESIDSAPPLAAFSDPRQALNFHTQWLAGRGRQRSAEANATFLTGITGTVAYAVRVGGDPLTVAADVGRIASSVDPLAAVESVMPMERMIGATVAQPRFYAVLVGIFGALAAALAAIGIYGVLAYTVAQRTREIGIRVALGARRGEVMQLVMRQGLTLVAVGILAGVLGALALTRYLAGMLFGLTPLDLPTYIAVTLGFACIALLASYIPARRAMNVNPLVALRYE